MLLGLDISSKTGIVVVSYDNKLISYEQLEIDNPNKHDDFPLSVFPWANKNFAKIVDKIEELFNKYKIDKIIIERTNLGRARDSQSFLEATHAYLYDYLYQNYKEGFVYLDSSEWRKLVGMRLSTDQKKQNKLINQENKKGNKVIKVNGKRIGKINKKHLAINLCEQIYGLKLKMKDNNIADATMLCYAYLLKGENK